MAKYWADTGTGVVRWVKVTRLDFENPLGTTVKLVDNVEDASDIADEIIDIVKGSTIYPIYRWSHHEVSNGVPSVVTSDNGLYLKVNKITINADDGQETVIKGKDYKTTVSQDKNGLKISILKEDDKKESSLDDSYTTKYYLFSKYEPELAIGRYGSNLLGKPDFYGIYEWRYGLYDVPSESDTFTPREISYELSKVFNLEGFKIIQDNIVNKAINDDEHTLLEFVKNWK